MNDYEAIGKNLTPRKSTLIVMSDGTALLFCLWPFARPPKQIGHAIKTSTEHWRPPK